MMDEAAEHESMAALRDRLQNEDAMDKAVKLFQRAKTSRSRADINNLMQALLQVAEQNAPENATVTDDTSPVEPKAEVVHDWTLGTAQDQTFGVWLNGKPRVVINADGEVWGSERQGYIGNWTKADPKDAVDLSQPFAQTTVQSGGWKVSDTECGCLGFYYKGKPVFALTKEGRLWSEAQQGYAQGQAEDTLPEWVPTRYNLKDGETYSTGTWRYGETTAGAFAFFSGDNLAAAVDRFGEVYTVSDGRLTEVSIEKTINPHQDSGNMIHPTDTDCVLNSWAPYGVCSKECGSGVQTRIRTTLIQPTNKGAQCGPLEESRNCNTHGCAVDCEMGAWGEWNKCDKTCGVGQHTRKREILTYPSSQGKQCGPVKDSKPCNTQSCDAKLCSDIDEAASFNMDKSDEAFFFSGSKVVRWDFSTNSFANEAGSAAAELTDSGSWNLLPEAFANGVDAAINLKSDSEKVWLVKGTSLLQWDLKEGKPVGVQGTLGQTAPFDELPHPFDGQQPAAHNASAIGTFVDAAVLRKQHTSEVYLFQGSNYLLYDFETKQVLDGPSELESWSNLPSPFNKKIDAAVNRRGDTSEVFLFSGTQYIRWDINEKALVKPEGGPFTTALHKQFSGLGLHTCGGYDMENIGSNSSLVRQISKVAPKPAAVENVIAGASWAGYADNTKLAFSVAEVAKGDSGLSAAFDNPAGIAVLGIGSDQPYAYVADSHNHAIRRVSLSGCDSQKLGCKAGNVTTVAGGSQSAGFKDGNGAHATFFKPRGVSGVRVDSGLSPGDLLYIADTGNSAIRRLFVPKGADMGEVLTVAGGGGTQCSKCVAEFPEDQHGCTGCCECKQHGFAEGIGAMALFSSPTDVALLYEPESRGLGANEYVYVTDAKNHAIRRVIIKPGIEAPGLTGEVSTVAGTADEQYNPTAGFSDGNGASAQFSCVSEEGAPACAIDATRETEARNDVLYVADTHNNALRRIVVPTEFSSLGAVSDNEETAAEETPAARKLLSEVEVLAASETLPTRYTASGGTAPKDMKCNLPFKFAGRAYNDCVKIPDTSLGMTEEQVSENGWCPSGTEDNPKWAPCQPPDYTPTYCVMSPWTVFGTCSTTCGGGVQTRTRTIEIEGDGGMGCPALNQTRPCAQFKCGQVSTVAGGHKAPFGVLEDGVTSDDAFFPHHVSIHVNGLNDDVVYVSGDPRTSAQLKRAEIKKGTVDSDGDCAPGHKHMPGVDPLIEGDKCAMPISNAGAFPGLSGLAVVSEQLVVATTAQHTVTGLDLTLQVDCEPWLTNALNHWDSDPQATGAVKQTNPLTTYLVPSAGFVNRWKFTGYRRVLNQPDLKFGKGSIVKNVVCTQEEARPEEGINTQQACCVTKAAPQLIKPTLCNFLEKSGSTFKCPDAMSAEARDAQKQAECQPDVCVRDVSGPGSSAWTQAESMVKIAVADYIAEEALLAQKLMAM